MIVSPMLVKLPHLLWNDLQVSDKDVARVSVDDVLKVSHFFWRVLDPSGVDNFEEERPPVTQHPDVHVLSAGRPEFDT